jgi:hypothetical protein
MINPGESRLYIFSQMLCLIRGIGGPGGSGVSLIMLAGSLVRNLLSDDWDLIGFDPRGVGLTK